MVKSRDFSRPLSVFQVLFKANLFSMTFQDSPVYSSTFQACANPEYQCFSLAPTDTDSVVIVCLFVALCPKSTAMVIAGRSVHLTTLFPGQA